MRPINGMTSILSYQFQDEALKTQIQFKLGKGKFDMPVGCFILLMRLRGLEKIVKDNIHELIQQCWRQDR